MRLSTDFAVTRVAGLNMSFMSWHHATALSTGRKMWNDRVQMTQPSTVLVSDGWPSPESLRSDMASARGSGSCGATGRKTECIASGGACYALWTWFERCTAVVTKSSM